MQIMKGHFRRFIIPLLFIFTFIALMIAAGSCGPKAGESFHFLDGRRDRMYVMHPAKDENEPAPLVLVLHGYDGQALSAATVWRLQKGMNNFHILAPQAPMTKRRGRVVSTWTGQNDEKYLLYLLEQTIATHKVNGRRIAVVGYSSGASMALRMALKYPSRFYACVAVGGGLSLVGAQNPEGLHVFLLAGQKDRGFNQDKAKRLAKHLGDRGAKVEYAVVPGADHSLLYNKIEPAAVWLAKILDT
jgi:predicted esterase